MHDLILLTPLGVMNNRKVTDENDADTPCNSQSNERTKSLQNDDNFGERKSRQIMKTLALIIISGKNLADFLWRVQYLVELIFQH